MNVNDDLDMIIPAEPGCIGLCTVGEAHLEFAKLPVIAWRIRSADTGMKHWHDGIAVWPITPDPSLYVEAVKYPSGEIIGIGEKYRVHSEHDAMEIVIRRRHKVGTLKFASQ